MNTYSAGQWTAANTYDGSNIITGKFANWGKWQGGGFGSAQRHLLSYGRLWIFSAEYRA